MRQARHLLEAARLAEHLEVGGDGGEPERVGVVRAGLEHAPVTDQRHDVGAAADRAHGETRRHRLAEARQVGHDTEQALGATQPDAEPGLHLVEHEHRSVTVAQRAQPLEVAGFRFDHAEVAADRLGDDAGDLLADRIEQLLEGGEIVPAHDDRVVGDSWRDALRVRHDPRPRDRAGVVRAGGVGQGDLVAPTVVLPFELDDVTATGGGAGEAHRREHRFGPRRAEADHLDPRHQLDEGTGDLRLQRVAGAVHRTAAKLLA